MYGFSGFSGRALRPASTHSAFSTAPGQLVYTRASAKSGPNASGPRVSYRQAMILDVDERRRLQVGYGPRQVGMVVARPDGPALASDVARDQ